MNPVDGGIVAISFREANGNTVVHGTWTRASYRPGETVHVQQFRSDELIGLWALKAAGVYRTADLGAATALTLMPRASDAGPDFLPGDALVFGEGRPATLTARHSVSLTRAVVVSTPGHRMHGVLLANNERNLVLFCRDGDVISPEELSGLSWRDTPIRPEIAEIDRLAAYALELYFDEDRIPLGALSQVLPLVRDFILDTSDEFVFKTTRTSKGGRRHKKTYAMFEPELRAEAGSIRIFLHPPLRGELDLTALPDRALRLLFRLLQLAAQGDEHALHAAITAQVFSAKKQAATLKKIAAAALASGNFVFRTSDGESVVVDSTSFRTLHRVLRDTEARTVARIGYLYAIDTIRFWCKVLVKTGGQTEDWTLRYGPELANRVPLYTTKSASVTFSTSSPLDQLRGTGELLTINDAQP
jgi:hypothetical protein